MPTTNPFITFARMRVDTQRLIALAHSDTLREQVKKLLPVYDILERMFNEQPIGAKPMKLPSKKAQRAEYLNELREQGRAAFFANVPHTANPWLNGGATREEYAAWNGAWQQAWHNTQEGGANE